MTEAGSSDAPEVCAIGHALTDVTAHCDESFLKRHRIKKGMMRLIDAKEMHALREKLPGEARVTPGGSACNTAVALAEMDVATSFMGTVAADAIGERFRRALRNAGVFCPIPPVEHDGMSGVSVIFVTPDGERSMNSCLGVSADLEARHLDRSVLARARWLFLEGYLLDNAQWDDVFAAVLEARTGRIALSLSDPLCVARHRERLQEIVARHADLVIGNQAEIRALSGRFGVRNIARSLADRSGIVVVTCSGKPALVARGDSLSKVPAKRVATVADATGAGDHFAAGFLKGLLGDRPLPECAEFGHACAAAVIGRIGGR